MASPFSCRNGFRIGEKRFVFDPATERRPRTLPVRAGIYLDVERDVPHVFSAFTVI